MLMKAIAEEYVSTAQPVASQKLLEKFGFAFSSATVRSEMNVLEEMGFLFQPHTSAGRVPTQKAYRFYVDALSGVGLPTLDEQGWVNQQFEKIQQEVDSALELTAKMLSWMLKSASLATVLFPEENHIRHIELIPLHDKTVLCVLIFGKGYVQKKTISVPENISPSVLNALSKILNKYLGGYSLKDVKIGALREIEREIAGIAPSMKEVLLRVVREMLVPVMPGKIYFEGAQHVLAQPEFQSVEMLRSLFSILEEETVLVNLLSESFMSVHGVKIIIGEENPHKEMGQYSMVLSPYIVGGKRAGAIGILGPTRMPYAKNISIVKYLAEKLGEVLSEQVYL